LQKLEKQAFPFTNLPLYILKIIEDDLQLPWLLCKTWLRISLTELHSTLPPNEIIKCMLIKHENIQNSVCKWKTVK
jgi:hypothetical protein